MKLVVATGNPGKLREFREALADASVEVVSSAERKLGTFPEETGSSYEENAFIKAAFAAARSGLPALGDDSGLEVEALGGEPGVYTARYGGDLEEGERIAYLLKKLRGVPEGARGARFVCSLVLATPDGDLKSFSGACEGHILEGPRGTGGFGYDPVFYSPELGKSFAEASAEEKRRVSHRGRALEGFRSWLATPEARQLLRR